MSSSTPRQASAIAIGAGTVGGSLVHHGASRPSPNGVPVATTAGPAASVGFPDTASASAHSAERGRLLIQCRDQPGVVSAVSTFLTAAGANIVTLAQHSTGKNGGPFFQRTEFHLPGLPAARDDLARLRRRGRR